jgi:hypothetical protein
MYMRICAHRRRSYSQYLIDGINHQTTSSYHLITYLYTSTFYNSINAYLTCVFAGAGVQKSLNNALRITNDIF